MYKHSWDVVKFVCVKRVLSVRNKRSLISSESIEMFFFCSCTPKVCDTYPTAPDGYKVVSERSDDCCYSYRLVKDDCDVSACSIKPPVCNYFEDLQFYANTDDQCCGTYECACNPNKCLHVQNVCPVGTSKMISDKIACCPVSKCVFDASASAFAQSDASASLLGNSFMSIFTAEDEDDKRIQLSAVSQVSSNANANAQSASSQDLSLQTGSDNSGLSSVTTIVQGSLSGEAASNSGVSLASSYGLYATGRYNELAKTYAKALASAESGSIEGCCPGVVDGSSCPSTCPSDRVCDGKSCVYPRDCPCFTKSVQKPVST